MGELMNVSHVTVVAEARLWLENVFYSGVILISLNM